MPCIEDVVVAATFKGYDGETAVAEEEEKGAIDAGDAALRGPAMFTVAEGEVRRLSKYFWPSQALS